MNYYSCIIIYKLLIQGKQTVKKQPGFISSSLHRSLDGEKVTMYAQLKSISRHNEMLNNPDALPYLQQALEIASFEPGMYEVVQTLPMALKINEEVLSDLNTLLQLVNDGNKGNQHVK